MSENNTDLNEVLEEEMDDSTVITVPIDETLSNSGEAADAKAVGDALALKADRSELQTAITVNGQAADAQGAILVNGTQIPMSGTDSTTLKAAIETVDGKTGADIPVDNSVGAQTIKQALATGATRTADQIEMSASDDTTVKEAIDGVGTNLEELAATVAGLSEKTAANIKYQSGSNETIKEHVDGIDQGLVKTVYGKGPDENGDVSPEYVPLADNLYTEDAEKVDASFLIRTTAGSGSLSDGPAWIQKMKGNRTHAGYVAESIGMTVTPEPRTAPAAITASIDNAAFETAAGEAGTYEFNYTDSWDVNPATYGITVSNTPIDGDLITVVWDGENDPVMTVTAATRTAPPVITATLTRDTWVAEVSNSGTYTFTYTTAWKLSGTEVDMDDYGITITNDPVSGDVITVAYTKEVRGTITVATPSDLVATGWNLYDHAHGYARCVKYSNVYGYLIMGTYTSLAFAETLTGTQTAITPDADGMFNVPGTGYIIVTGGNGTDTAIVCTWSDWITGPADWEAYSESTVDISSIMSANFPYGLCKVVSGSDTVCDEIDFVHKKAISKISRVAYTEEARASAAASGRAYEVDENYIYQVRASEVVADITIDEEYTANEHGMEWFAGSTVDVYSEIIYGSNLKDKLKRDVVTISEQTLTPGQQRQVRENIGAGSAATDANLIQEIVGPVNNLGYAIASGEYFIANGAKYKATASIPNGSVWATSAESVTDHDLINALNGKFTTLTGTSNANGYTNIQYPTGFSVSNCIVVSVMLVNAEGNWYAFSAVNDAFVSLRTTDIFLSVTNESLKGKDYKITLMKN